ncbi:MAG: M48 family metalloprotease [Planctomycetota bacterium]
MAIRFGGRGSSMGMGGRRGGRRRGNLKARLVIAAVLVLVAVGGYLFNTSTNPYTGQSQRVAGISLQQEIALGLQAVPQMSQQFGGRSSNVEGQRLLENIGEKLLRAIPAVYPIESVNDIPHEFSFTLLDDDQTVNAFALPGGPTFITDALFDRLTEGQIAGVMGHEIVHVVERHGLQRMAKDQMFQGIAGAATTAAGDVSAGQISQMVTNFLQMSYGRDQELQCDQYGVLLMVEAGYDPRAMIEVMRILGEASGGSGTPEWASTHPDPGNRQEALAQQIKDLFPEGVPEGLIP